MLLEVQTYLIDISITNYYYTLRVIINKFILMCSTNICNLTFFKLSEEN